MASKVPNKKQKTKEVLRNLDRRLQRSKRKKQNLEDETDCACEIDRFTVATTSHPDITVNSATGRTDVMRNAWFIAYFRNNGCCRCCEFRQYVRGYAELNGTAVAPPVPGFNFLTWQQDQDSNGMNYGHRSQPAETLNRYVPDQATGCIYLGQDAPGFRGLSPGDDYFIYFEFADVIIDTCNGDDVVAGPEFWDMIAAGTT